MVRTQYMTMFTQCGTDTAKAIVAAKRGLGSQFKAAVTQLLQENKKAEKHEIVAAFDVAIEAMEDAAGRNTWIARNNRGWSEPR